MNSTGRVRLVAVSATIAVAAALAVTNGSASAADQASHRGTPGAKVSDKKIHRSAQGVGPRALGGKAAPGEPGSALPAGVPTKGRYAFLVELDTASTSHAYRSAIGGGKAAARTASKRQLGTVKSAQDRVVSDLPAGSKVLYKAHSALAAVAVTTDVKNYTRLTRMSGVAAVEVWVSRCGAGRCARHSSGPSRRTGAGYRPPVRCGPGRRGATTIDAVRACAIGAPGRGVCG